MENDSDVTIIFNGRIEKQCVTERSESVCDCRKCQVKLSKLPPSTYCKLNCDVTLSKLYSSDYSSYNCDLSSHFLFPKQRIFETGPGDPGDPRNTKRRTARLNMTFDPIKVEIEHTDKLEKQRKPNSKKCVKLKRDRRGFKHTPSKHSSKNEEDPSNKEQVSPIETETISSPEVHEIDVDSSKQDLENLKQSPFKSAVNLSTMGLNASTMSPFRRSSKKRRLSTNSENDESEKDKKGGAGEASEIRRCATTDNESGLTVNNEPHNSPKKLKRSKSSCSYVDATLENGVPSSKKRKLSTASTDEETTIWTDEEIDGFFIFDAPEYKKERELLAAVLDVSELTMNAIYDKLLSMDSKHILNIRKLVKSLKSTTKVQGTTKLLDLLCKKLSKYSDISSKNEAINSHLGSASSIEAAPPSSPCSTIVQEDSNQMVDTSVSFVEPDECEVRATIRKELDKIRRLKEDARIADHNKLYDDNRTKMADSSKNIFASIDEIEKEMEANDLEELDTEDVRLDVPLPPDEGICMPSEEMRDPHCLVDCAGSEKSVDSGVSMQSERSEFNDRRTPPPYYTNYDEEKIKKYIESTTIPETDSHVLPKRKTGPVNDSVFRAPATPKKSNKKEEKVYYLKVNEMSRDRFDLLKKFDYKKCYYLPDSEKHIMSEKLKLPKMASWIPVSRNRLFDVEAPMANIPYFGDQEVENPLIKSMEEEYNKTIEDNRTRKKEEEEREEDNTDFLQLFNALLKTKFNFSEEDPEFAPDSLFRKTETIQEKWFVKNYEAQQHLLFYFRAYAIDFPEEGDTDELIKRYLELVRNIPFPNIDQEKKVFEGIHMGEDKVLNSYQVLYCRRCYEYDCKLHEEDQQEKINRESPYFFSIEQNQKSRIKMETRECGDNCFLRSDLNVTMSPGKSSSPRKSLSPRKSIRSPRELELMSPPSPGLPNTMKNYTMIDWNPTQEEDEEQMGMEAQQWSTYEELFCRKLLDTYQITPNVDTYENGFCAVSRLMITKTCRQVYEKFGNGSKKTRKNKKVVNGTKKKHKKKEKKNKLQAEMVDNKHNYSPCFHPGQECSKDLDGCSCFKSNNFCDKFCFCDKSCKNRFPGCSCTSICTTKHCSCFLAQRECDPDVCGKCGASDFKYDPHPDSKRCKNIALQRNMGKKLLIGKSDIDAAGWGCILGEDAKKDELIAEYVGEIITTKEAEMRGAVYDTRRGSYMFTLNNEFMVDAGRYGGKIRFANHSSTPNCNVRIMRVLGDFRIGLYAAKDLKEEEELFFNYGEHFTGHEMV